MATQSLNLPYIALAGVVAISLIAIFVVIVPQYQQVQEGRAALYTAESRLAERQSFLRSVDQKRSELETQQVAEKDLSVMLPTDTALDDVLRIMHRTATETGVTVISLTNNSNSVQASLRSARARGEVTELPTGIVPLGANLTVVGTYQQLRAFLTALERSPRLMEVASISFERNQPQPDGLEAVFTIHFYSFQDKS